MNLQNPSVYIVVLFVVQQIDFSVPDPQPQAVTSPTVSFFDAFPTVINDEQYLLSGIDFEAIGGLYGQTDTDLQYSDLIQRIDPSDDSLLNTPVFASSVEVFEWQNRYYASFQLSDDGNTTDAAGEIWVSSLFDDDRRDDNVLYRVSDSSPALRSDPEFYIGSDNVWVFYVSRPLGDEPAVYELHRASTDLTPRRIR